MPDNDPLAILDRIVKRSHLPKTLHSKDIELLLPAVQVRGDGEIVLSGEYVVRPGSDGAIHIGDRVYRGPDAEAVRGTLREVLTLGGVPHPPWLQLALLDRIALEGSHTASDIEHLLPAVQVRDDGEIVLSGEYVVRPGDGFDLSIGDRIYQGSRAEAVRGTLCEILTRKRLPAPRWLQLAILDRIAREDSHTASDIELLLPAVQVGGDGEIVLWGEYVFRSKAEAVREAFREILTQKRISLPRWLRLPATHMSVAGAFALLFGVLTLAFSLVPLIGVLAFPLGFATVVTAAVAFRRIRTGGLGGRSLAVAGLLTGVIGLVVATYAFVVFLLGFRGPAWQGDVNDLRDLFQTEPR